jgi:hypothetical protein
MLPLAPCYQPGWDASGPEPKALKSEENPMILLTEIQIRRTSRRLDGGELRTPSREGVGEGR